MFSFDLVSITHLSFCGTSEHFQLTHYKCQALYVRIAMGGHFPQKNIHPARTERVLYQFGSKLLIPFPATKIKHMASHG